MLTPTKIKNILAVRNDRFGEFLLNIPAFRALKETFAHARITAVVNPDVKELAELIPFIDETIEWGRGKHTLIEKLSLISILRKKNIDIAVMLNPSRDFNIFTYLAGIPVRAGYNRKLGLLLNYRMEDKKYLGESHEIDYNLQLVRLIGAQTQDKSLSLSIDSNIIGDLNKEYNIGAKDSIVAIHPFTSDPNKQWPVENFKALAQKLAGTPKVKAVIIGGIEEIAKAEASFGFSDKEGNLINLTGKTTLRQLAGILAKSRLLISGDSGPVHLAACLNRPVVAIFRSDIPAKSSNRWGPVSKDSVVIEKNDLSEISVEEVLTKVKEALKI